MFIHIIKEQNVIEYIFGESTHAELIKRSDSILKFLIHHNYYNTSYTDLIWKCCIGRIYFRITPIRKT